MSTVAQKEEEKGKFSISILETVTKREDLAEVLRYIADMIDKGNTSGYYPGWEIVDEGAKK